MSDRRTKTGFLALALAACLAMGLCMSANAQTIIYVNAAAAAGGNGQSWATAYNDLQQALDRTETIPEATRNIEVWIAQGVYRPSKLRLPLNEPRTATFSIPNFTVLIGGFQGDELTSTESLPNQHVVTLSGDLGNNDGPPIDPDTFPNRADNVFNVVLISGGGGTSNGSYRPYPTIKGCTITGGDGATAPVGFQEGGGVFIYETPAVLSHCTIIRNRSMGGGGVGVRQSGPPHKTLDFTRCKFLANHATVDSGALRLVTGDTFGGAWQNWRIDQCLIAHNTASDIGGLYAAYGADLYQTTIANNRAEHDFGGAHLSNATNWAGSRMFACIHYGNTAPNTFPGLYVPYGLQFASYSLIDGPDPLFRDTDGPDNIRGTPDDDFSLTAGSPAIDKWTDTPGRWGRDLADSFAPADGNGNGTAEFDAGPYEYDAHPFSPIIRVKPVGAGRQDGSTWDDAVGGLQAALARSTLYVGAYQQIWVAAGTYRPSLSLPLGGSRSASFQLQNNLAIYGGFAGTETALSQRVLPITNADAIDPTKATILSGDLNGDDVGELNRNDNSYSVLTATSLSPSSVLDGVTVFGGNAIGSPSNQGGAMTVIGGSGPGANYAGGGVFRHVIFQSNSALSGGAVSVQSSGRALFENTVFRQNWATDRGGAVMENADGLVQYRSCVFEGNSARSGSGGAIVLADGAVAYPIGSTFIRNRSYAAGGAVHAYNSSWFHATNCGFFGNTSEIGSVGALFVQNCTGVGAVRLSNCGFVGNAALGAGADAGAIGAGNSNTELLNCVIVANQSWFRGAIYHAYQTLKIRNSLIWGNASGQGYSGEGAQLFHLEGGNVDVSASTVEGWSGSFGGTNNTGSNPLFVRMPSPGADFVWGTADDNYGDLRLQVGSPAIDSGDSAAVLQDYFDVDNDGNTSESLPLDLTGFPRFVDDPGVANTGPGAAPHVDRGAYESQVNCFTCPGPREWRSVLGGPFDFAGDWTPSVPLATHDTLFNLPATYPVSFATSGSITNRSATFRDGNVSLALAGNTWSLTSGVEPSLVVGDTPNRSATLQIQDGRVNALEVRIGSITGSVGTVKVLGDGSATTPSARLATTEGLCVGCQGEGTLDIRDGARVSCLYGFLGEQSGSTGQISITGPGSRLDAPFFLAIDNGNVNVSNGGTLATGSFGAIYIFPNGSISGDGTISGHVVNFGGIAPGNSPGTLTITGNYDQVGVLDNLGNVSGKLVAQAGGASAGQFDKLVVTGSATLGGGLSLSLLNGYVPSPTDQLPVVSVAGGLVNPFDVVFFPALDNTAASSKYFRAAYSGLRGPGAGTVTINLGNLPISPAFNSPSQQLLDNPPSGVAVGDLNGDGLPDVAITVPDPVDPEHTTGVVVVLFNQGGVGPNWQGFASHLPGNPTTIPPIPVGLNPKAAAIARIDPTSAVAKHLIVANSSSNSLSILKLTGAAMELIASQATDPEPISLAATDFSGLGGNSDIVTVACGGGSSAITGSLTMLANTSTSGTSLSFVRRNIPSPPNHRPVYIRPFNPDQDKDIDAAVVMKTVNGGADVVAIYINGRNPGLPVPLPDLYNVNGAATMLPVGSGPVQTMAGRLSPPSLSNPPGQREDLVTVNNTASSISVLVNTNSTQDSPIFAPAVDYAFDVNGTTAAGPRSGAIADLDGNGSLDLAVVANNPSGTNRVLKLLRNDSTTNLGVTQVAFAQMPDLAAGSKPLAVASADIDADGQVDLVTINSTSGRDSPNTIQFVRNALPAPAAATGACCSGAACILQQATQCAGLNQRFSGLGSSCNAPGNGRTPCCKADFEQNGSLAVSDIFAYLNAWFAGSLQSDTSDNHTLSVSDIFEFLNNWFQGC